MRFRSENEDEVVFKRRVGKRRFAPAIRLASSVLVFLFSSTDLTAQPFTYDVSGELIDILKLENEQSVIVRSGATLNGAVTGTVDETGNVPSDDYDLIGADGVTVILEEDATLLLPQRQSGAFVRRTMAIDVGSDSTVAIAGTVNTENGKGGVYFGANSRLIGGFDADGNALAYTGTINASAVSAALLSQFPGNTRAGALVIGGPLSEDLIIDGRITSGRYSRSGTIRINENADVPDGGTRRIVLTENAEILNLDSLVDIESKGIEDLEASSTGVVGIPVGEAIALLADGYVIDNATTLDSVFIGRQEDFSRPISAEFINRSTGVVYNAIEAIDGVDLTLRSEGGMIEGIHVYDSYGRGLETSPARLTLQGLEGGDGVFRAQIGTPERSGSSNTHGDIWTSVLYGDNTLEVQAKGIDIEELEDGSSLTLVGDSVIYYNDGSSSSGNFDVNRGSGRIALLDNTLVRTSIRTPYMERLDFELGENARVHGHLLFGHAPSFLWGTNYAGSDITSEALQLTALIAGDVMGQDSSSVPVASGAGSLYFTQGDITITETGRIRQLVGNSATVVNSGRIYAGSVYRDVLGAGYNGASVLLDGGTWINTEGSFIGRGADTPVSGPSQGSLFIGYSDPIGDPSVDPTSRVATLRNAGVIMGDVELGNNFPVAIFQSFFDPVTGSRNDVSYEDALYTINLSGLLDENGNETPLSGVIGGDLSALGRITTDRFENDALVGGRFTIDQLVAESDPDALVEVANTGQILSGLTLGRISTSHVDLNNQGHISGAHGRTSSNERFPSVIFGALDPEDYPNISEFFGNQFGDTADRTASVAIHGNAIITNGAPTADGSLHAAYIGAADLTDEQIEAIGFDDIVPFDDRELTPWGGTINESPRSTNGHGIYVAGRLVGDSVNYGTIEASNSITGTFWGGGDAILLWSGGGPSMEEAVTFTNYGLIRSAHQNGFNSVATSSSENAAFTHFVNHGTVEAGWQARSGSETTAIREAVSLQNYGTIRGRYGWVYNGDYLITASENTGTIEANSYAVELLGLDTTFINTATGRILSEGTGIYLDEGVRSYDPEAETPNGVYNYGLIHTQSDSIESDGPNPLYVYNAAGATIQADYANAVLKQRGGGGTVVNFGDLIGDYTVNFQHTPGDVFNERGARILSGQNGYGSAIYMYTEDPDAREATVINRGGGPEGTNGEITTTGYYANPDAAIVFDGASGRIVNEAGAKIQALSPAEDNGYFLESGEGAAGIAVYGYVVNWSPREVHYVDVDIENAGIITSTLGRGVDFDWLARVRTFENTGQISGGANGVEVEELSGSTLYNRAGGVIETTSSGGGWAGIAIFGGEGTIVNETGATISAPDAIDYRSFDDGSWEGGEAAIFIESYDGKITIDNAGLLDGAYTINAWTQTDVINTGDISADLVTVGDAVSLGGGGVLDNRVGGLITATNDAVYLWENDGTGFVTEIHNAAGATLTGDSDGDGAGSAIASYNNGIEHVFNIGMINGDVLLGSNDDLFASIDAGTVFGDIDGGDGRDTARMAALTVDQTVIGDGIVNFEILEKTGPYTTEVTGTLFAEQTSILGGTVALGRPAIGEIQGVSGGIALSNLSNSLSMGDGSELTTTTLMVRGPGSLLDTDGSVGGDVIELIGDNGRQVILNERALIEASISLGGGDDKVTNAFGTYGGSIDLGDGDDELEVFLLAADEASGEASVGGRIAGSVTGGEGIDTIRYSLESGEVTLSASQIGDVGAASAPTGFERIAKGGAGTVIFDFTEVTIGDTTLSTNTFDIEGPTVFNTETTTAAVVEGDSSSGMIYLGQATAPGTELGYAEGVITNNSTLVAEGGIVMTGLSRIVNSSEHSLTTHGDMGITGDDGAQTLTNAGALTVLNGGAIELLGGDDLLETSDVVTADVALGDDEDSLLISTTGSVSGTSSGGAGFDHLSIDTGISSTRQITSGDFGGFEDVDLNTTEGATGVFEIMGANVFAADDGALSDVFLYRGTLTGTGGVSGSLTVGDQDGTDMAILAPGTSPGVVTVEGDLVLTSNSILAMELFGTARLTQGDPLDAQNDLIVVANDVTLDGALSIVEDADGLDITNGNFYTLIQYGGALNGPGFQTDNLDSLTGATGWSVDTVTIPGEVIIIYSGPTGGAPTIYWDGGDGPVTADNTVGGGVGVWDGDNTNWTTAIGDFNDSWTPGLGIFQTVGGAVEVNGVQAFQELRFEVDGYVIEDQSGNDGGLQMLGGGSAIDVIADASTTIAVTISDPTGGPGLFTKSGEGRLLLTQANDYTGGTALVGGTLAISDAAALSSGALAMNDGTTLEAAASLTVSNTIQIGGPGSDSVTIDTGAFDLALTGAITSDDTDRLAKTGAGGLTLAGASEIGGLDVAEGGVTVTGSVDLAVDLTLGANTQLGVAQGASVTSVNGLKGLTGVQSVDVAGQLTGDVGLGDDEDAFTLTASGVFAGAAQGGQGRDALTIDAGSSATRQINAADFSGFEDIVLNSASDATGAFEIAGDGVFAADDGGLSEVTLTRGTLTGSGGIAGDLTILVGASITPGASIGTIGVAGDYTQAGVYRFEYRAPADQTTFITSPNGGNAFVARNTVFGLGGAPLASDIDAQDADLIAASGQVVLQDGAGLIVSSLSSSIELDAALQLTDNTARELRYLILRAEGGGTGALNGITLGDVDIEYLNDAGAVIATQGTADATTTGWTNAVLVVSGEGGVIPDDPPLGWSDAVAAFSLRPEIVNAGCISDNVLLLSQTEGADGSCVWMQTSTARGSAELPGGLNEDLSEWEINLGAEAHVDDETEGYDTRVGFVLGWRETTLDYSTAAQSEIDTLRFGAYADLRRGETDLHFSAIWTRNDVTTQRNGLLDGARISGNYDANTFTLNARLTHWQNLDANWDLGWVVGVSYATGDRDAYTETGSALEAFQFQSESGNALWATVGMAAKYRSHSPTGKQLGSSSTPTDVNLFAGFDFLVSGDPAFDTTGSYNGNPSTLLASGGASRWEDTAFRIEADLTTRIDDNTTFSAGLSARFTGSSETFSAFVALRRQW